MSNIDSIEITADSVEDATAEALAQLSARSTEVTVEVLATPRTGVLGLGARQARVRVTRKAAAGTARADAPRVYAPRADARPASPDARPAGRDARPSDTPAEKNQIASAAKSDDGSGSNRKSADQQEQRREATVILKQILEKMGEHAEVNQIEVDADSVELEIKGDGSGILIGRHGQTLDALEYVVNRILARRIKDAAPISLETESYRSRRRQQLHRMAMSVGERAKREHQTVRLDPMPPRDRRVVHLALKDDPMITTRSAGEGFLRSIEIVPAEGSGRRERTNQQGQSQGQAQAKGPGQGRGRPPEREREREREPERKDEAIGEQGGFKHGQKRIV
jgi:spoIIIJ-associated protein